MDRFRTATMLPAARKPIGIRSIEAHDPMKTRDWKNTLRGLLKAWRRETYAEDRCPHIDISFIHDNRIANQTEDGTLQRLLGHLCSLYGESTKRQRHLLRGHVHDYLRQDLDQYARRMAVKLLREGSTKYLSMGLIALAIADSDDPRETLLSLCPLEYAASQRGIDPAPFFREASDMSSSRTSEVFLEFLMRSPASKTLEQFGYRDVDTPSGRSLVWFPLVVS